MSAQLNIQRTRECALFFTQYWKEFMHDIPTRFTEDEAQKLASITHKIVPNDCKLLYEITRYPPTGKGR